jgi:hypothetical protein
MAMLPCIGSCCTWAWTIKKMTHDCYSNLGLGKKQTESQCMGIRGKHIFILFTILLNMGLKCDPQKSDRHSLTEGMPIYTKTSSPILSKQYAYACLIWDLQFGLQSLSLTIEVIS